MNTQMKEILIISYVFLKKEAKNSLIKAIIRLGIVYKGTQPFVYFFIR